MLPIQNANQLMNLLFSGPNQSVNAGLLGSVLGGMRPQPSRFPMMDTLAQMRGMFPNAMGGAMNEMFALNAQNAANAGAANERDLRWAMAQLAAQSQQNMNTQNNETSRYVADQQREQGFYEPQASIFNTGMTAGASQNNALAAALAQLGVGQYNAMGQYLGGMPAAQASMYNTPIQAGASQNIAGIQGLADVLGASIPANLAYALAPAQMGSQERIAGMQSQGDVTGSLANAMAQQYAARQGAGANMYGARAGADAAMHGANQQFAGDALASQLGFRGLQDTNATQRYLGNVGLTGTALGHQLGLQGIQDTNRANLAMNQGTNRTNLGIAGLGAGADVLGSRLGLEGTRATADASRFGSQQNALASIFGSGAGLQSVREQEAARNARFRTATGPVLDKILGRFSAPPQFGGFRTSYGTGVTV